MIRIFEILVISVLLSACASGPRTASNSSSSPETRPSSAIGEDSAGPSTPAPTTPPTTVSPTRPGAYYKDDGPGENPPPDLASVPDAEPKSEPLHRFANRPYVALGQSFTPRKQIEAFREQGIASWYGKRFHGGRTASGEIYDMYAMTAAHPTLPIPSYVRVTNVSNGKSVVVRINDRGPFHKSRIIDLSYTAAWKLGYVSRGSAKVDVEAIIPEGVIVATRSKQSGKNAQNATLPDESSAAIVASAAPTSLQAPLATMGTEPAPGVSEQRGVFLQLGTFSSSENALGFRDYVQQELKGLREVLSVLSDGDRHRLHLGPFASVREARDLAEHIAQKLKFKPFVVQR